jgi:hypothetical protein
MRSFARNPGADRGFPQCARRQLDTGQRAPRIMGRRFQGPMNHNGTAPWHFDLHVWTIRKNPRGTFAQYNRRVSCDAA